MLSLRHHVLGVIREGNSEEETPQFPQILDVDSTKPISEAIGKLQEAINAVKDANRIYPNKPCSKVEEYLNGIVNSLKTKVKNKKEESFT